MTAPSLQQAVREQRDREIAAQLDLRARKAERHGSGEAAAHLHAFAQDLRAGLVE